eukprot:TRINITY_DN11122_c0_g1_i2.p1 TRINITY_DN11122_c0_g1~~TRINITY_DN11122_c0_g1_i2.p1  ORF type:complete len:277 (+),score=101.61 TRINITY_DN11122_c0_g1_i2:98-832(+)
MADRMREMEQMLQQEMQQMRMHNESLQEVARKLVSDREIAFKQMLEVQEQMEMEKIEQLRAAEQIRKILVDERDLVLGELEDLRKMVSAMAEAERNSSGLTVKMEEFLKRTIEEKKPEFINSVQPVDHQAEGARALIQHMVEAYGAPESWSSHHLRESFPDLPWTNDAVRPDTELTASAELSFVPSAPLPASDPASMALPLVSMDEVETDQGDEENAERVAAAAAASFSDGSMKRERRTKRAVG